MQVATLFRESASLLGASLDGTAMDGSKYCMKPEAPADDGYETMCGPQFLGGAHHFDPGMRHPGMNPMPPHPNNAHNHAMDHHHNNPHARSGMNPMKMEQYGGDPYSFVDEVPNMDYMCNNNSINGNPTNPPQPKKRGRRKKSDQQRNHELNEVTMKSPDQEKLDAKERKRQDRFNGLTEEEVSRRTLPDHLTPNLDVIIVGINPGMFAAYKGHHYAGPGNHFWKCLYLSGLVPEPFTADDDFNLVNYGIGFTNMVARPTKGSADLTRREIKQGSQILLEKLQKYRPKIAVFNGKLIYEVFSGKKDFPFGRQPEFVDGTNTYIWVMPSSSARCAQLPRAADKVPFYMALKKFRDYLNGLISEIDESEVVFHEPNKSSNKSNSVGSPSSGETNGVGSKGDSLSTPNGEGGSTTPAKKKRGRPRKGMEKNNETKAAKLAKTTSKEDQKPLGPDDPPRKRRGRPKKVKPEEGKVASSKSGNAAGDSYERSISSSSTAATVQTQKASSVSSGYSTGTSGSNSSEERNGSLSNAGSNGLSPSHHSFTTQSDLSSEISAAISCGSCPPSPLNSNATNNNSNNNQTETVFDSLSMSNSGQQRNQPADLNHHNNKQVINSLHGNGQPRDSPNCSNMYQSSAVGGMIDSPHSHEQSYHHGHPQFQQPTYDNRFHPVSNRSQGYSQANSREEQSSMQAPASYPQQQQQQAQPAQQTPQQTYEQKVLDITTKSLSGLESLVDQIPSIAEAEGNGPGPHLGAIGSDAAISHTQSISSLSTTPSAVSHFSESSSGFLPYGHHVPVSTYASASHYATAPYYASELSSSFPPVSSLSSAYSPSPSLFGYHGYHSQYHSGASSGGYGPSGTSSIHLPPSAYGTPPNYPSAYSTSNPYMQGHTMQPPGSGGQRYPPQRPFHLRQDGMDLGPLGFGGF